MSKKNSCEEIDDDEIDIEFLIHTMCSIMMGILIGDELIGTILSRDADMQE